MQPPRSAPPTPMPDPRPQPSAPPPSYTPDEPSDAEKTVYEEVRRPTKGKIVGVLVGVDGPCDGQLYPLFDGENTLGRGEQCRVVLSRDDRRISREHAEVIHREGVFVVRPLKERAVTLVNEEETEGSGLAHGDSLTLGDSTFKFVCVY
jgi:pSer/pThr/pTyr-binding forkhead associated (FHA) protein